MNDYVLITIVAGKYYAIFNQRTNKFELDMASPNDAAERLAKLMVPELLRRIMQAPNQLNYDTAKVLAGLVQCCRCHKTIGVMQYSGKLPLDKQWCNECKGGL